LSTGPTLSERNTERRKLRARYRVFDLPRVIVVSPAAHRRPVNVRTTTTAIGNKRPTTRSISDTIFIDNYRLSDVNVSTFIISPVQHTRATDKSAKTCTVIIIVMIATTAHTRSTDTSAATAPFWHPTVFYL
jgi:hypothetical protein